MNLRVAIVSDLHVTINGVRADKVNNFEQLINDGGSAASNDGSGAASNRVDGGRAASNRVDGGRAAIDLILIVGDILDEGANGENDCVYENGCCFTREHDNQLAVFKCIENQLSEHFPVYLCMGNHDTYTVSKKTAVHKFLFRRWPRNTIQGHIQHKHISKLRHVNDFCYDFYIPKNEKQYHFICLGIYPDSSAISFLSKKLESKLDTVIFFHYNLFGPHSDWWTSAEKETFYNTIKGFTNIKYIVVGHHHITQKQPWNEFTVVSGAGSDHMIIEL